MPMFLNLASFRLLHTIREDARVYVSLHATKDYPEGLADKLPAGKVARERAIHNMEILGLVRKYEGREAWRLTEKGEAVYQLNKDRVGRRLRDE